MTQVAMRVTVHTPMKSSVNMTKRTFDRMNCEAGVKGEEESGGGGEIGGGARGGARGFGR